MAKNKVTVELGNLKNALIKKESIATPEFQKKLGDRVVGDVKDFIAVGKSPVKGKSRYKGYAAQRLKGQDPKTLYPNSVKKQYPSKRKRPVNLSLSGKMLSKLTWEKIKGGVRVGLINASAEIKEIFNAHNSKNAPNRKFPRRPMLPTGKGEDFTQYIKQRINSLYRARIRQIIMKMKKKR